MSDPFEPAGGVPEDVLRLAEAYIFASPDPVTAHMLAPLLPEGQNAHSVLDALQARCAWRGVVLAEVGLRSLRDLPGAGLPLPVAAGRAGKGAAPTAGGFSGGSDGSDAA